MIVFKIKSKRQPMGRRKGRTVYYAEPVGRQQLTTKMMVERIVHETALSTGDVVSALISLASVVRDALASGQSVDLGELGRLRVIVPPRMMDSPEEVTAESLKRPKIVFTPKRDMLAAAHSVRLRVWRGEEE